MNGKQTMTWVKTFYSPPQVGRSLGSQERHHMHLFCLRHPGKIFTVNEECHQPNPVTLRASSEGAVLAPLKEGDVFWDGRGSCCCPESPEQSKAAAESGIQCCLATCWVPPLGHGALNEHHEVVTTFITLAEPSSCPRRPLLAGSLPLTPLSSTASAYSPIASISAWKWEGGTACKRYNSGGGVDKGGACMATPPPPTPAPGSSLPIACVHQLPACWGPG
nr:uncharacterized protein LOC105880514 [Microcebus murinus]